MTLLSRCLPGIAILLTAISSPVLAKPRQQRPDAEGYSCKARDRLVVKSVDHDFVIVRRDPVAAQRSGDRSYASAEISVGAAHRIDRSIFFTPKLHTAEMINAPR